MEKVGKKLSPGSLGGGHVSTCDFAVVLGIRPIVVRTPFLEIGTGSPSLSSTVDRVFTSKKKYGPRRGAISTQTNGRVCKSKGQASDAKRNCLFDSA